MKDDWISAWQNHWFGFWRVEKGDGSIPSVEEVVDTNWSPDDRGSLIEYLKNSPVAVTTAVGFCKCLCCSQQLEIGCFRTDGVWLWPDDLVHYVESHRVRLPDAFVDHMRLHNYIPPAILTRPSDELPWP